MFNNSVDSESLICIHHDMKLPSQPKVPQKHIKFGDNHLVNCNLCGAFFPKNGSMVIRSLQRQGQMCKVFSSDILRSMYSSCH